MEVLNSIIDFFTNMDFNALLEDLGAIVNNVDMDLISETISSLVETLKDLFAQL